MQVKSGMSPHYRKRITDMGSYGSEMEGNKSGWTDKVNDEISSVNQGASERCAQDSQQDGNSIRKAITQSASMQRVEDPHTKSMLASFGLTTQENNGAASTPPESRPAQPHQTLDYFPLGMSLVINQTPGGIEKGKGNPEQNAAQGFADYIANPTKVFDQMENLMKLGLEKVSDLPLVKGAREITKMLDSGDREQINEAAERLRSASQNLSIKEFNALCLMVRNSNPKDYILNIDRDVNRDGRLVTSLDKKGSDAGWAIAIKNKNGEVEESFRAVPDTFRGKYAEQEGLNKLSDLTSPKQRQDLERFKGCFDDPAKAGQKLIDMLAQYKDQPEKLRPIMEHLASWLKSEKGVEMQYLYKRLLLSQSDSPKEMLIIDPHSRENTYPHGDKLAVILSKNGKWDINPEAITAKFQAIKDGKSRR